MKKNKLAFGLAILASFICISNFLYKLVRFTEYDYMILLAGVFIGAIGVSAYFRKA